LPENRQDAVIDFALVPAAIDVAGFPVVQEAVMKQFVAITDDVLYRPDGPPGPIVPYQCGVFCWHQLREETLAQTRTELVQRPSEERALVSA